MENNNYIVSARKYRPSAFESVVGQKALTETLRNAIRSNHLAHAYLFCGPRGVGKTTCARIFAKTINCLNPTADHDACNECESCRAFNEQRSFNIHELDAASNNSVEDIRSLIEQVRIPPQIGKYSVYIIDEVHMLSQGAFNALLKTLEEPPSYAIFILATTEKHKVLPTILSRCQVFDFARMSVTDTVRHLQYVAQQEGIQAEEEALNVIAQKADGGMRDALSIFDQLVTFSGNNITYQKAIDVLNVLNTDYYFRLVDLALSGANPDSTSVAEALLLFNEVLCKGFDPGHFIGGLASHLRDLLVSKDPATTILLETSDAVRQHYAEQAAKCSAKWLFAALDVVNTADLNFRTARNKRLSVELMLVKLCNLLTPSATPVAAPVAQPAARPAAPAAQPAAAQPAARPAAPAAQPAARPAAPAAQPAARPAASAAQPAARPSAPQATPVMAGVVPGAMPTFPGAMPTMPGAMPVMPGAITPTTNTPSANPLSPQGMENHPVNGSKRVGAEGGIGAPESRPFTAEQMATAWRTVGPTLFADDERVNAMLSNMAIERVDDLTYCLPLLNEFQQNDMIRLRPTILKYLGQQLHNSQVKLTFRVVDHEMVQTAFTAEERLKLLQEMNPQLDALRQTLKLSLE